MRTFSSLSPPGFTGINNNSAIVKHPLTLGYIIYILQCVSFTKALLLIFYFFCYFTIGYYLLFVVICVPNKLLCVQQSNVFSDRIAVFRETELNSLTA